MSKSHTDAGDPDGIDEIVRRLAQDPEFQARTADLMDRASRAKRLEDIGPVIGVEASVADGKPTADESVSEKPDPEETATLRAGGKEYAPGEHGRPAAEEVAAMRKEWDEGLWRKTRRTLPTDDLPVGELIPEDVLSDMERLTEIVCRSVHELDQHLIGLDLGSWCDELLAYSDGLTAAMVGSRDMRGQMLMLRVRAHREAHPDFDVHSLLGPQDYVRHLDATRQLIEQAHDLDDPNVQRAIEQFRDTLRAKAQEPSAEEARHRSEPEPAVSPTGGEEDTYIDRVWVVLRDDGESIDVYADRDAADEGANICGSGAQKEEVIQEPWANEFLDELRETYEHRQREPSVEETRRRARPLPPRHEMAIDDLSDQEAEAFLNTITGDEDR